MHPFIYKRMVRAASSGARAGDVVAVFDRSGSRFGSGFYNPRSQIALRMLAFDDRPVDDAFFRRLLEAAVGLRRGLLGLDAVTNAYRLVHAEGDGLSGLVVDRYADVLAVEVFSLGAWRLLDRLLPILHELAGTRRERVAVDAAAAAHEGMAPPPGDPGAEVRSVRIEEHGARFAVAYEEGQTTGFFCDQRENRRRFAELARGRSVLDVCTYTGGFAIHAARAGAREVSGIDLDEKAVAQARHNANLNQVRARWVHADAFSYMRQMRENQGSWEAVVLDPPKLIGSRAEYDEGTKRYFDINKLALGLVSPGGLFLTCSCSGLLPRDEFRRIVLAAARRAGRTLQLLQATGAGPDHPVMANCPESEYLKALWVRVMA
jgi:23S rRNA (cytosine1962-C5)-methyltransferase